MFRNQSKPTKKSVAVNVIAPFGAVPVGVDDCVANTITPL